MTLDKLRQEVDRIKTEIILENRSKEKLFLELKKHGLDSVEKADQYIDDLLEDIENLQIKEAEALNAANRLMDEISNGED